MKILRKKHTSDHISNIVFNYSIILSKLWYFYIEECEKGQVFNKIFTNQTQYFLFYFILYSITSKEVYKTVIATITD